MTNYTLVNQKTDEIIGTNMNQKAVGEYVFRNTDLPLPTGYHYLRDAYKLAYLQGFRKAIRGECDLVAFRSKDWEEIQKET